MSHYINLTVINIKGGLSTTLIQPSATVFQLKQQLQDERGLVIDRLRIMFAGKQLSDDRTLADYNIQDGASIHILLRTIG